MHQQRNQMVVFRRKSFFGFDMCPSQDTNRRPARSGCSQIDIIYIESQRIFLPIDRLGHLVKLTPLAVLPAHWLVHEPVKIPKT
jgi:hypothetical protein